MIASRKSPGRNGTAALDMGAMRGELVEMLERFSNSYRGTDATRTRWTRGYSRGSADVHLTTSDLESFREQCRHMDRNNCIFEGLVNRAVDNVIGTGFTFQMRTTDEVLNADVEAAMGEWAASGADYYGTMSLEQMERMAFRALIVDGDMGFVKLRDGSLQSIEADLLTTPTGKSGDTAYTDGVEKDRFDRPIRYHVAQWSKWGTADAAKTQPVSAADFIHLANRKRFSQTRGIPELAGALELFERLDDYVEATLVAAQVAACQSLVVLTEQGAALGETQATGSETSAQNNTQHTIEMEPGATHYLKPGESLAQVKPEQPAGSFDTFTDKVLRFVGLGLGMPLELVSLDMSKANYSSSRVGLLQAYLAFRGWQQMLLKQFFRPVTAWKLPQILRALGADDLPEHRKYLWIAPGWRWIDPLAETSAAKMAAASGLRTLQDIAADEGRYWRDELAQRAVEIRNAIDEAKRLGGDVSWRDLIPAEPKAAAPAPAPAKEAA